MAYLTLENLRTITQGYKKGKLGVTVERVFGKTSYYLFDNGMDAIQRNWDICPKNQLSTVWQTQHKTKNNPLNIERRYNLLYAETFSPTDYYASLDSEPDPGNYIRRLMLYPASGINLNRYNYNYIPVWSDPEEREYLRKNLKSTIGNVQFMDFTHDYRNDKKLIIDVESIGENHVKIADEKSNPDAVFQAVMPFFNTDDIVVSKNYPFGIRAVYWQKDLESIDTGRYRAAFRQYKDVLTAATTMTALPMVRTHRLTYAEYVRRFGEIITTKSILNTLDIGKLTLQEDLLDAQKELSYYINRVLAVLPAMIESGYEVITLYRHEGNIERRVECTLPDDFITGPEIRIDGNVFTCKQALLYMVQKAQTLGYNRLIDLAARIAQLEDPTVTLQRPEYMEDPANNAYLVYDPIESEKQGIPVYRNTAVNKTIPTAGTYTVVPPAATIARLPTVEHYNLAPQKILDAIRNIKLENGGSVSKQDLIDMGIFKGKQGGSDAVPWIIGGIAGVIALTQFMG